MTEISTETSEEIIYPPDLIDNPPPPNDNTNNSSGSSNGSPNSSININREGRRDNSSNSTSNGSNSGNQPNNISNSNLNSSTNSSNDSNPDNQLIIHIQQPNQNLSNHSPSQCEILNTCLKIFYWVVEKKLDITFFVECAYIDNPIIGIGIDYISMYKEVNSDNEYNLLIYLVYIFSSFVVLTYVFCFKDKNKKYNIDDTVLGEWNTFALVILMSIFFVFGMCLHIEYFTLRTERFHFELKYMSFFILGCYIFLKKFGCNWVTIVIPSFFFYYYALLYLKNSHLKKIFCFLLTSASLISCISKCLFYFIMTELRIRMKQESKCNSFLYMVLFVALSVVIVFALKAIFFQYPEGFIKYLGLNFAIFKIFLIWPPLTFGIVLLLVHLFVLAYTIDNSNEKLGWCLFMNSVLVGVFSVLNFNFCGRVCEYVRWDIVYFAVEEIVCLIMLFFLYKNNNNNSNDDNDNNNTDNDTNITKYYDQFSDEEICVNDYR